MVFSSQNSVLPRIFLIFLEQCWFILLQISVVQGIISIAQGNIYWSGKFEQCWFFLEQHWFKGLKISVAQGKCRKNSIDQIFLKLNGISVDSRTALLKVALLKELLYIYNTSLEINRVVWSLCSLYQKKIPILPPLWEKSGHLTVHEKKIESPKQWILKGGMYIYILLLIST